MAGLVHIRERAPLFGGSIALWSMLFNFSKGSLMYMRQEDDIYNSMFGGFMAGLLAHLRGSLSLGLY